jgi:hypothetical protein
MTYLAKLVEYQQIDLRLPRLALEEFEAKVREKLIDMVSEFERVASKNQAWLGRNDGPFIQIPTESDAKSRASARRQEWEDFISDGKATLLEFPRVNYERLVNRCLSKKRPFQPKRDDEGFRDALIWESVLEIAQSSNEQVVLISDDSNAFGTHESERFHPDLANELEEIGLSAEYVLYFSTVRSFIDLMFGETMPMDNRIFDARSEANRRITDVLFAYAKFALVGQPVSVDLANHAYIGIDATVETVDASIGIRVSSAATRGDGEHSLTGELLVSGSASVRLVPRLQVDLGEGDTRWDLEDELASHLRNQLVHTSRATMHVSVSAGFSAVFDPTLVYLRNAEFNDLRVIRAAGEKLQ